MIDENSNLSHELIRRIFGNIGAVAGKNFGKVGITTSEFIAKYISVEIDDNEFKFPVWIGKLTSPPAFKIALANLDTQESPDFCMVLLNQDQFICFKTDSSSSSGYQWIEDRWIELNILHKLNITVAFEMLTQQGILWEPDKNSDVLIDKLVSVIEME